MKLLFTFLASLLATSGLASDGYVVKTSGTTVIAATGDKFYSVTNGTLVLDSGGVSTATYWTLASTNGTTVKGSVNSNDPVFNSVTHVWHLEEASGNARVDSKGSANLSESGGNVGSTTGKHNTAARFFVTDQGDLLSGSAAITPDPDVCSVSLWIKVHTRPAALTYVVIFSMMPDSEMSISLQSSGIIVGQASIDDTQVTTSALSLDVWHHIVFRADENDFEYLYLDGSIADQQAGQSHVFIDTQAQVGGGTLTVADVAIDEVYLWPIMLTDANSITLWNSSNGIWYSP